MEIVLLDLVFLDWCIGEGPFSPYAFMYLRDESPFLAVTARGISDSDREILWFTKECFYIKCCYSSASVLRCLLIWIVDGSTSNVG